MREIRMIFGLRMVAVWKPLMMYTPTYLWFQYNLWGNMGVHIT